MPLARAMTAFAGASLALMGVNLAAGAARHADADLAWQRQWRQAVGREARDDSRARVLILRAYRLGGAALGAGGVALLAAAARGFGPAPGISGRLGLFSAGVSLTTIGLGLAALRLRRESRRRGAADVSFWALCALWVLFGLRLVVEALR